MTQGARAGALGQGPFAWYVAARTVSRAGTALTTVALAFAVLHITGSAGALALVLAARTLALLCVLPLGGIAADRVSPALVIQLAHATAFLSQGLAAYLVLSDRAEIWHLMALEAVGGAVMGLTTPAMVSIVPLLVPPALVQQANAVLSFSRGALDIAGPAVAGLLVVGPGPGWALLADSLTYLAAIPLLAMTRLPRGLRGEASPRASMGRELREGWVEFRSRTWVWLVVAVFAGVNAIAIGTHGVLGPAVSKSSERIGESGWGVALAAEAVGTLAMTVVLMRATLRRPLRTGLATIAVGAVPIAALASDQSLTVLAVGFLLAGAGAEVFAVGWTTALQQHVPAHVLSRVSSYDALGSYLALPLGALLYGWLGTAFDPHAVLLVSSVLFAVLTLGALTSRAVRDLTGGPTVEPLRAGHHPPVAPPREP